MTLALSLLYLALSKTRLVHSLLTGLSPNFMRIQVGFPPCALSSRLTHHACISEHIGTVTPLEQAQPLSDRSCHCGQ